MPRKKGTTSEPQSSTTTSTKTAKVLDGGIDGPYNETDKTLSDLVIGHNSHVAHPEKEGLYIGAITKSPHGFKGRLYAEPYNAEFIRSGAAMYRSHNAILRKRRPDVRFTILHMWQSEQNAA